MAEVFQDKTKVMAGLVEQAVNEAIKFDKGNRAAVTRYRQLMQQIKVMAHELRAEIIAARKLLPKGKMPEGAKANLSPRFQKKEAAAK